MAKYLKIVLIHFLFVPWVVAQRFTNPAGADNTFTYTVGEVVDLTWADIAGYSELSLGLSELGNGYISWLISNDFSFPTSYTWTVSPVSFTLTDTTEFILTIYNGTDFGIPFTSPSFKMTTQSSQSTSSSSTSSSSTSSSSTTSTTSSATSTSITTITATTVIATSSSTAIATPNSSPSLSIGATVGLGVGIPLAFAIGLAIAWFVLCSRRRSGANRHSANAPDKNTYQNPPPAYGKGIEAQRLTELETPGNQYHNRAELG